MSKYIEQELALSFPFANGRYDHENANEHFIIGCESYKEWLENIPAYDGLPVYKAEWIAEEDRRFRWHCSRCEYVVGPLIKEYNYCPNCGSEMRWLSSD